MNKRITYTQLKRLENKAKAERLDKALERYKKLYSDSNDLDAEEMLADMIRVMKGEEDE